MMARPPQSSTCDGGSPPVDSCGIIEHDLCVISYNMHGFRQGLAAVRDLMLAIQPDVLLLQEHWLTPANLHKFDDEFPQYVCFGSSAMRTCVGSGALRGRHLVALWVLINKRLKNYTQLVCAADRYVIFAVGDLLFVNVYFP